MKGLLIFTVLFLLATPYIVNQYQTISGHAATVYDFKTYFPNTSMIGKYYLEGFNYVSGSPVRSVLWFEPQDQWTFRMYNSAPEDVNKRCHYDQLSWWDDGTLRYVKTHDECPGSTPNEIVYDAPIIFLPKNWDPSAGNWSFSGSSNATYSENGVVKCTGINNYTAKILGVEQIASGVSGIHWQSSQATNWTTGSVAGKCYAGYTTHWLEDYWLYANLPINGGGTAPALKRSKGGNLDVKSDSWDIWFDSWKLLPWAPTPTPISTVTPTSTPTTVPTPTLTPAPTPKPKDTKAPVVSITSPRNGAVVNRNAVVTLKASASDNVAVSKVEFYYKSPYLSNTLICQPSPKPYTCKLTVPNRRNVAYTVTAKAYDTSGNTSSSSISLTVR